MQRIIRTIRRLPGSDLTAQRAKKGLSSLLSMLFTLLLCFSLPAAQASDREIYSTASQGNITVMLGLDQSSSMNAYFSTTACDVPQGGTEVRYAETTSYREDFVNKYATKHPGITFSYGRRFCTAKAPQIKYRRLGNSVSNYKYQVCIAKAGVTTPRYHVDCEWGAETTVSPTNIVGTVRSYTQPGTRGIRKVTIYYVRDTTTSKYYDRLTRLKDGVYEVLYGPNAVKDEISMGLGIYSLGYSPSIKSYNRCGTEVTGLTQNISALERGVICVPAQTLGSASAIGGASNQRVDLMRAVAGLVPYRTGSGASEHKPFHMTPSLAMYGELGAYLLGTNSLLRPLATPKYVNQIQYKYCEDGDGDRDAAGACTDWFSVGTTAASWYDTSLPSNVDINSLEEAPIARCLAGATENASRLVGMQHCYTSKRIVARHVKAVKDGVTLWRSCIDWNGVGGTDQAGGCRGNTGTYWRNNNRSGNTNDWSATAPSDPKMIDFDALTDEQIENLTDEQRNNAYQAISDVDYKCPSVDARLGLDESYDFTCYGGYEDVPVFATIQTNRWRTCLDTANSDSNGVCREFTPEGTGLIDTHWSTTAPTDINDLKDNGDPKYVSGFCSSSSYISNAIVPGNGAGRTGICYYDENSTKYFPHESVRTSGFVEAAPAAKNMTNTDILKQTYRLPASIQSQIDTNQQCGGQAIYMLSDGEPNTTDVLETGKMYRAALTSPDTINLARNFNCRNAPFNGTNTPFACAAKFSRALLNYETNANPINRPIKTAFVGFGGDYLDLPEYDNSLSISQNANMITSYNGSTQRRKNMALLGVHGEGGWYRGNSAEDIASSIRDLINKFAVTIPPLNTGVVTIPVDALNPIQIQDSVYYPEFQPRPDVSFPLWLGNFKKFKVLNGVYVDSENNNILNQRGTPRSNLSDLWKGADAIAGALGKIPLRNETGRKLFINQIKITSDGVDRYEAATSGTADNGYGLTPITANYLNSTDANRGYLLALLGYSLSQQQADNPSLISDETILNGTPVLRQMGAAIHSNPILLTQSGRVNFDTSGNAITDEDSRDEYVGVGLQQGLFQVVNAKTGIEKFAFVPYEMLQTQKRGFLNRAFVNGLSGTYYGIDGPWTAYTEYVSKGDDLGTLTVGTGVKSTQGKQWVYGGLRMGGRSYYSLDLGDMNTPKLKFWINPAGAAVGTPLSYMGQSWSKPTLAYVNWKGVRKLVMLVGGGYDPGYESDSYNQVNGQGAGVYMFDADNGNLLWWSSNNPSASTNTGLTENALKVDNMSYSVTSRINTLDRDSDGLVDALYFADLGGQVWRVDINNNATANVIKNDKPNVQFATRAVRLLNLNATATVNGSVIGVSPRFYEAPSIGVYSDPSGGKFVAIAAGSGNRSQPYTAQYAPSVANGRVKDAIYVVYDKDIARTNLYTIASSALNTNNLVLANLIESTDKVTGTAASDTDNGWYYRFSTIKSSEVNNIQNAKVIGEMTLINKNLYVPVYDAAQDGASGVCGTGIKGSTIAHRFCLPYGKCAVLGTNESNELYLGSGISGINVGVGSNNTSLRVVGGVCDGDGSNCSNIGGVTTNKSLLKSQHSINRVLMPKQWYKPNARP